MEWKKVGSTPPLKPRTQRSGIKRKASVLWDCDEIIYIDWLPEGKTINSILLYNIDRNTRSNQH